METEYHGIDLHTSTLVCHRIVEHSGSAALSRTSLSLKTDALEQDFFPVLKGNEVVCVEASGCSAWFATAVAPFVKKVHVINPFDFKALYCGPKKTDKVDARKLADFIFRTEKFPDDQANQVYVPSPPIQELRKHMSLYRFLGKEVVSVKNRITSLFRSKCVPMTYAAFAGNREGFLKHPRLDDSDRLQIAMLESVLKEMTAQRNTLEQVIVRHAVRTQADDMRLLCSINGISLLGAACLIADIADIRRFKTAKKLCSYLSSAPKIDASNETVRIKSTNKRGRKVAYQTVLQGINHLINHNPTLERFYEIKQHGKSRNKVRAAIVRKTFETVFYMLKNRSAYRYAIGTAYNRKLKELEKIAQAA